MGILRMKLINVHHIPRSTFDISSSLDIEEEKESKFDIANIGTTPAIRNMDRDVNPSCKNCVDAGRPVPTNATVTGCNQQLVGTKSLLKYVINTKCFAA